MLKRIAAVAGLVVLLGAAGTQPATQPDHSGWLAAQPKKILDMVDAHAKVFPSPPTVGAGADISVPYIKREREWVAANAAGQIVTLIAFKPKAGDREFMVWEASRPDLNFTVRLMDPTDAQKMQIQTAAPGTRFEITGKIGDRGLMIQRNAGELLCSIFLVKSTVKPSP